MLARSFEAVVAKAVPSNSVRTYLRKDIRTIPPSAESLWTWVRVAMPATLQIEFRRVARINAQNLDAPAAQIRQASGGESPRPDQAQRVRAARVAQGGADRDRLQRRPTRLAALDA